MILLAVRPCRVFSHTAQFILHTLVGRTKPQNVQCSKLLASDSFVKLVFLFHLQLPPLYFRIESFIFSIVPSLHFFPLFCIRESQHCVTSTDSKLTVNLQNQCSGTSEGIQHGLHFTHSDDKYLLIQMSLIHQFLTHAHCSESADS